jgi:hypothetical protein
MLVVCRSARYQYAVPKCGRHLCGIPRGGGCRYRPWLADPAPIGRLPDIHPSRGESVRLNDANLGRNDSRFR